MPPFVTYVLLGLCGALMIFGILVERRPEDDPRFGRVRRFAWVLQIGAVVAAYLVLRPGSMPSDPREAIKVAGTARAPVFLDLYSNF